jgi:hypothetical protein
LVFSIIDFSQYNSTVAGLNFCVRECKTISSILEPALYSSSSKLSYLTAETKEDGKNQRRSFISNSLALGVALSLGRENSFALPDEQNEKEISALNGGAKKLISL